MKRNQTIFFLPALVFVLLLMGLFGVRLAFLAALAIGVGKIIHNSYESIREKRYSLDYIAFLALLVSVYSGEYLAGSVIALMFTTGAALEAFASSRAQTALKKLSDTIPKYCLVRRAGTYVETPIQKVREGDVIMIKRDEIVPLDGMVRSPQEVVLNLSNLTGEAAPITIASDTFVKSGSVNVGASLELKVVGDFSSSTYHKIVNLVEYAREHPARTVRLSERANFFFTLVTFVIAGVAFAVTGDVVRLLAILVIATPCPLIIAAPVAFVSGMSRTARAGIILRKPAAFENLHKADVVFFDKTGTLTLGEPRLLEVELLGRQKRAGARGSEKAWREKGVKSAEDILAVAAGIEIHSLHPLARAIVAEARKRNVKFAHAENISERIGKGIEGDVDGARWHIRAAKDGERGMALAMMRDKVETARFHFSDVLKKGAAGILRKLQKQGVRVAVITGDKKKNAEKVFRGMDVEMHTEQSPEEKYSIIKKEQAAGHTVVMVGDGLNDAPALALADVGVVFSGTENGASIEAADVAVLGHDMADVVELFDASHRTLRIARQSIYGGIALSTVGMLGAAFGFIVPVAGALIQEGIDIVVILNALRALKK